MRIKTWLILGGVIGCVIVAVVVTMMFSPAIPVKAARVKTDRAWECVDEQAKTRLPETYLITMPIAGRIDSVVVEGEKDLKDWKEGDPVHEGDVLARIVPGDLELTVQQATAIVGRLRASIEENRDVSVEETAARQAEQFVDSVQKLVKAAWESVKSGEARHEYANKNLKRIRRLATTGARTQDDLEQATLEDLQAGFDLQREVFMHASVVAMAAATDLMPQLIRQYVARKKLTEAVLQQQKAEAQARLQQILQDQQRGTMKSPVDGVVLHRFVTNEEFLAPGTPLLEIGQPEKLEVEAEILSLDVVKVREGQRVEIHGPAIGELPDGGKDKIRAYAKGTVEKIYPAGFTKISSLGVEQQRVKVIIRFDPKDLHRLLQERGLGVGYRVRVRIYTAEKPKALVIPRSAPFRGPKGNWQVYAVRNGRARIQDVQLGLSNDDRVEIKANSGLSEGDQVVLAPEGNLTDKARVKVETEERNKG